MKIISLVSIMFFLLTPSISVVPETAPRTTADMYLESIASVVPNPANDTSAEYRARQYRAIYERCDQDHNCTNQTAGGREGMTPKGENQRLLEEQVAGRFPHTVILQ